jgi:hypothetical protein
MLHSSKKASRALPKSPSNKSSTKQDEKVETKINKMNEDFLANVQHEGQADGDKVFQSLDDVAEQDNQGTDTSDAPPAETNQTENAPSSQGAEDTSNTEHANNVPWHKDPRWVEWQRQKDELLKFKEETEPKLVALQPQEQSDIPSWFGGDSEAWSQYLSFQSQREAQVKQAALNEVEAKQKAETDRITQANQYVEQELASLEAQGKKFDRNELLKVVSDYKPINDEGKWDFVRAHEILELKKLKESKPENLQARKDLAGATKSTATGEPSAKTYFTPGDFRGKRF